MYVLVDYDNLLDDQSRLSLQELARRIADAVCGAVTPPPNTLNIRLYGGWYAVDPDAETHGPTQEAQRLIAEITGAGFPFFHTPPATGRRVRILLSLARSLLVDPERDIVRTFRPKRLDKLVGKPRSEKNVCQHADVAQCCLRGLKRLFTKQACPECAAVSTDFLPRGEQKLVDTMIATDLLHLSADSEGVALVSSDDDFVPPILQAAITGGTVYHVQTYSNRILDSYYRPSPGLGYHSLSL